MLPMATDPLPGGGTSPDAASLFNSLLDTELFGQPHFGFVENVFEAGETGKGKPIDRKGAHFSDGRIGFQRRASTGFMNERQHDRASPLLDHQPT